MSTATPPPEPNIPDIFLKPYDPGAHEDRLYTMWEESGYFNPDTCVKKGVTKADAETFSIVMPPPNANGSLHAGHALFVTIQDIMIRYARMQGKRTVWLPGADHAGFETQVVYEKKLEKEGRSRFQMTPAELYGEIMAFTQENKAFMLGQLRQLGASADFSRLLFTLDERVIKVVYDTFKQLEDDGLLYRGARIVNWCPKHQTSLSNLETDQKTRIDPFYYFKYGPFTIGTARPETKFGDKYVVMHPEDERYREYTHGQTFELEWINGPVTATVIKDDSIDMEFGTGVMTITPWHDATDFAIAKRHNLDYEQVIDWRGKLLPIAGEFSGMSITDARHKIVEKLNAKGLLVKVDEKYEHAVPCCYKCEREIEPQVRAQWFVTMKPLADRALKAVADGELKFVTEAQERIFKHWLSNIEDWNISRQIVWGIPIPAKICTSCGHGFVDVEDTARVCKKCGASTLEKDPDTFDTWFSSGQWPLATTDFPDGKDFTEYYPTTVMETGRDIIFFWVSRMVMFGLYRTGKVPFEWVYLHGMVRDKHGKKMSKSKGNVIAPSEIQALYGTDALRMGLIVNNAPGTDMNLDPDKVNAYKKFCNKLWNIARFTLTALDGYEKTTVTYSPRDEEILATCKAATAEITRLMDEWRYDLASEHAYHYVWHELADKILEESKPIIGSEDTEAKAARQAVLAECLVTSLKILHPFMPFVTEAIWQELPKHLKEEDMLLVTKWPRITAA